MRSAAILFGLIALATIAAPSPAAAQPPWTPPVFISGSLPEAAPQAVGGGEVLLDAVLGANGVVRDVTVLRETPPFTEAAAAAVRGWRFRGAEGAHVLVAYIVRPPVLRGPTLGAVPADTATPGDALAFPTRLVTPEYPPRATGAAVVLVEVAVSAEGRASGVVVRRSAGAFDEAAIAAARQWTFRPARVDGQVVATTAEIIFSWRAPVVAPQIPR